MSLTAERRRTVTLAETGAEFWRHPSPWIIATTLVGALVARVAVGGWSLADLWAPAAFLALFPVIEWVIHVFVLHWRPREVAGVTLDTQLARKHREHHASPRDIPLVFIPWQTLLGVVAVLVTAPLLVFPTVAQGLTFTLTVAAAGMVYEWTHYLVHSDYKPRTRLYRAVYKHHRLHHFKNENYWLTVTTAHTADRLFGTDPDPATVATSRTAKNLHGLG